MPTVSVTDRNTGPSLSRAGRVDAEFFDGLAVSRVHRVLVHVDVATGR
jgi:hypothetical protein